ncbi:MAG: lysophospholipid acyltransferase family protein [Bacteroidales bacterium]
MSKVSDYILSGVFRLISWFPLRILYIFSDLFYVVVYYVAGYRKKVVRKNLELSFPEMGTEERKKTEKDFYRYLCDSFLESVRVISMPEKEMRARMVFRNSELVDRYTREGRSVILCLGHYGNWEWVPSLFLHLNVKSIGGQLYRPLKNKFFDNFYLNIRQKWGTICIPKNDILREIRSIKETGLPFVIGFMADQTPSKNNIHYWTTFLNQDTPVLIGPEKISTKGDYVVIYLDVTRKKRGYYEGEYTLITDQAKKEEPFFVTETYIKMMENTIRRNPAYWLWTHKRWKHKKE